MKFESSIPGPLLRKCNAGWGENRSMSKIDSADLVFDDLPQFAAQIENILEKT